MIFPSSPSAVPVKWSLCVSQSLGPPVLLTLFAQNCSKILGVIGSQLFRKHHIESYNSHFWIESRELSGTTWSDRGRASYRRWEILINTMFLLTKYKLTTKDHLITWRENISVWKRYMKTWRVMILLYLSDVTSGKTQDNSMFKIKYMFNMHKICEK